MAAIRRWRNALSFRRIWGFGGLYKRKAPKAPLFCAHLGGKRPPRWGGGPAGARGGPSFVFPGSLRRNPLLTASGLMGLEFPAGGAKVDPSPYPPPKGGGWRAETEGPAPTPLSLPLERGGGAQRRRGSTRQLPPSVGEPPPNSAPSISHRLKAAAAWYPPTPHAALS